MDNWNKLFSLSYSCRQLYNDTRLLPYKLSVFQVTNSRLFDIWLSKVSKEKCACIATMSFKDVPLTMSFWEFSWIMPQKLDSCTGLRKLIHYDSLAVHIKGLLEQFALRKRLELLNEKDNAKEFVVYE